MISIVVAVSENGVIGVDNKLPWYIPEDLKNFKKITEGGTVIMGRKTYQSIGKPLPNRVNIIISRNKSLKIPGCLVVNSIEEAIKKSEKNKGTFIIGGGEIYKKSLKFVDNVYLTKVHTEIKGDTTFPELEPKIWSLVSEKPKEGFSYLIFKKK